MASPKKNILDYYDPSFFDKNYFNPTLIKKRKRKSPIEYVFYLDKRNGRDVLVPYMSCPSYLGGKVLDCWEHDRRNDGKRKLLTFDPHSCRFTQFTSYEDFKKDTLHYVESRRNN